MNKNTYKKPSGPRPFQQPPAFIEKNLSEIISAVQRVTTRENLQVQAIKSLGMRRPLCLIDVGSAKGIMNRWKVIKDEVYVYGFEPDSGARKKLKQNTEFLGGGNIDSPYALSDKKEKLELNILKKPSRSSALEPNYDLLNLYPQLHPVGFELDYKVNVDACDLDSLDFEAKDFMKIDVQGYELKVLKGAESSLSELLGLEIEVEFFEMYKNQCSFGEINDYLLNNNFEFIDFTSITRWERDNHKNNLGKCICADALFLKTPEFVYSKYKENSEKLRAYLSICLIYKRYDLIFTTLKLFNLENSTDYLRFSKISSLLRRRLNLADRLSRISSQIVRFFVSETDGSKMFY